MWSYAGLVQRRLVRPRKIAAANHPPEQSLGVPAHLVGSEAVASRRPRACSGPCAPVAAAVVNDEGLEPEGRTPQPKPVNKRPWRVFGSASSRFCEERGDSQC